MRFTANRNSFHEKITQINAVAAMPGMMIGTSTLRIALLHAPAQPSPALRRERVRDPSTLRALRLWDTADAALLNIGAPPAAVGDYGPTHHPRDTEALVFALDRGRCP